MSLDSLKIVRRLWVIEMMVGGAGWQPTVGCGITRDQAREECMRWREDNPADQFRVREYLPYERAS